MRYRRNDIPPWFGCWTASDPDERCITIAALERPPTTTFAIINPGIILDPKLRVIIISVSIAICLLYDKVT
jgi:hypothetical protein